MKIMIEILREQKKLVLLFGIVVTIYFVLGNFFAKTIRPPDDPWPEERVSYRIEEIKGPLEFLWSRDELFVLPEWTFFPPEMAASKGKVFLAGMLEQPEGYAEMLAFRAQDGSLAWRSDKFIPNAGLVAVPEALYAGANGFGTIVSYELNTGQILWSRRMPGARSIRHFDVIDNLIYIVSSAGIHFVQADTGEILKTLSEAPSAEILQETMMQFISSPAIQIKPEYFEGDLFIPSDLKFKAGEVIDRETGSQLWQMKGDVLSNIVTTPSAVYVLTSDRKLLVLDPKSGAVIAFVQFEPRGETLNSHNGFAHAFYVAVDEVMGIVYVFLGDGTELFAFKIVR